MIESNELLKTIIFPKNLMYLTDQLPKPSYDDDDVDEAFDEHIKCSTLPHKPKKKISDIYSNHRVLSRSKLSTQGKQTEKVTNYSRSSNSKGSRDHSQARSIMKNNYKELLKKHNLKNPNILNIVSYI